MTTARVPSVDIRPSRSAAANQRAVCRSSLRVRTGRSQLGAVSFSATSCTRVSIKMSLTMFAPNSVVDASGNPPHGGKHDKEKGIGPDSRRAVLTAMSVKHMWLYISRSTERHCNCQSGIWKREVGNAVRCLAHLRTAVANVFQSMKHCISMNLWRRRPRRQK